MAMALALTMILKGCKLMEVEEAERNSAMQTAAPIGPEGENSLAKDQAREEHTASVLRLAARYPGGCEGNGR